MPSFFESFGRLITGKPVFQEGDTQEGHHATTAQPAGQVGDHAAQPTSTGQSAQQPHDAGQHHGPATPRDASGRKVMPVVRVKSIDCNINGNKMDCWGVIKNDSQQPIELEKITVLGHHHEFGHLLRPGEERNCQLYNGPMPNNNSYKVAELEYKDHDGDWFASVHDVEYDYHAAENLYSLSEIRLRLPIKDIYG